MVKRYDQWHHRDAIDEMENGDYVLYSDYAALAERCERLEAQVLNLQGECNAAFEAGWDVCWERWSDKHHRSTVSVSDMNTDMDAYMRRRREELSESNGGKNG